MTFSPPPGWVSLPPGHTIKIMQFSTWKMVLGRPFSLDNPSDVFDLKKYATSVPEFSAALNAHLDDYLQLFPEPHWRVLFDGPAIVIDVVNQCAISYELAFLLEIVRWYKLVKKFDKKKFYCKVYEILLKYRPLFLKLRRRLSVQLVQLQNQWSFLQKC